MQKRAEGVFRYLGFTLLNSVAVVPLRRRKEELALELEIVAPMRNSGPLQLWTSGVRDGMPNRSAEMPRKSVDLPASLSP